MVARPSRRKDNPMGDILKYIDATGSYTTDEGTLSPSSVKAQQQFTQQNAGLSVGDKNTIKNYLNQILVLARQNRADMDTMVASLQTSENTLQEEIDSFKNDDIMVQLDKTKVNRSIFNIANVQYTDYYSFMIEYKYRLGIVSYKKLFLKAELKQLDEDIKTLQNYISTL